MRRIGVFGWGIVAPRSPNVDAFERNLERGESWLAPFDGFGPNNFLVGEPDFDFGTYRRWIDERFPPARYAQIVDKMDPTSLFGIGAFIQALGQNPGLEAELHRLGTEAHVYVGSGLGNLPTIYRTSVDLYRAQRKWDRFWADPKRNEALAAWLDRGPDGASGAEGAPPHPETVPAAEREDAEDAWNHYWAGRSSALQAYLDELREAESIDVKGNVESGKLAVIKLKSQRFARAQAKWGAPDPPWKSVSANLLWNISNTPSAQISMLGRITGLAFAPVGACSTFGVTLKLAYDAIQRGEAKAVVIGAADPPPHPISVGAFYAARVIAADAEVSKPLSGMRGTHVSGGAAIWIVGDLEHMRSRGFRPLGMEPVAIGVSSDADHIITPSKTGPITAVRQALAKAGIAPSAIGTWDLHATATPGDYLEVETMRDSLPASVLVTARKGTFGHGMGACGGWELTAQYLGMARGRLFPTPLPREDLNAEIRRIHELFVLDEPCAAPGGWAGKMSMGVGGVNACVLSRPWA